MILRIDFVDNLKRQQRPREGSCHASESYVSARVLSTEPAT